MLLLRWPALAPLSQSEIRFLQNLHILLALDIRYDFCVLHLVVSQQLIRSVRVSLGLPDQVRLHTAALALQRELDLALREMVDQRRSWRLVWLHFDDCLLAIHLVTWKVLSRQVGHRVHGQSIVLGRQIEESVVLAEVVL